MCFILRMVASHRLIIYMESIYNLEPPDWTGFEQWVEYQWRCEEPIYVSQDMKKIIASTTSFSVESIGPLNEHVVSELFVCLMPASFANSYIVNTEEDASHLRNLSLFTNGLNQSFLFIPFKVKDTILTTLYFQKL